MILLSERCNGAVAFHGEASLDDHFSQAWASIQKRHPALPECNFTFFEESSIPGTDAMAWLPREADGIPEVGINLKSLHYDPGHLFANVLHEAAHVLDWRENGYHHDCRDGSHANCHDARFEKAAARIGTTDYSAVITALDKSIMPWRNVYKSFAQENMTPEAQARDYSYPSKIAAEHVYLQMAANFPLESIAWVRRADWIGPVNILWEDIAKHDIKSWAASHEPAAVSRFARDIKAGTGNVNPSILIADDDTTENIVIDGHHRALARHKLGQPV